MVRRSLESVEAKLTTKLSVHHCKLGSQTKTIPVQPVGR